MPTSDPLSRRTQLSILRAASHALRGGVGFSLLIVVIAVLLKWHENIPDMEDLRWRLLLTLLGIAAGAWLARPIVAAARKFHNAISITGIAALIVSQICYYILIWGQVKTSATLWRIWWVAVVIAFACAHAAWVRLLLSGLPGRTWVKKLARVAYFCIPVAALFFIGLAMGKTPLPETSTTYYIAMAVPLAIGMIATLVLAIRAWRARFRELSPSQRVFRTTIITAGVFAVGFYIGRLSAIPPASFQPLPAALAHLSQPELDAQLNADFARLRMLCDGLDELISRTEMFRQQLHATRTAENRAFYRPAEEDRIRAAFMSYLAYRAALLRLAATYASFESIPDPSLRTRAFLIGYCAGTTTLRASELLVATYRDEEPARKKLNEPDIPAGLPAGMFDMLYSAVTDERNLSKIDEMSAYFQSRRPVWREQKLMNDEDFNWLDLRIANSLTAINAKRPDIASAHIEQLMERVKSDAYSPIYAAQSVVSTIIGDARMVSREPFISYSQIRTLQSQLQPGDIFLERRNWFMSNAFLPGFWPHAALYVGTIDDLQRLGLARRDGDRWTSDIPAIRDRLADYFQLAHDRQPITVIESVSEGVIFNSITHSMHADYVAVLRPHKLTDAQKAEAIARAFSHVGKPYDFEFDFFSADKLVCTELVYRSYDGLIKFDLVPVMGRDTLPAVEIARKFAGERTKEDRDLDFVAFLDADPSNARAVNADADAFITSITRPRGFNE